MGQTIEIQVPDIGDFDEVSVVEVLVGVGDTVSIDQALITLESDKASMEVPSTAAGTVQRVAVKVGDSIAQGAVIVTLDGVLASAAAVEAARSPEAEEAANPTEASTAGVAPPEPDAAAPVPAAAKPTAIAPASSDPEALKDAYASPGVRLLARELGVALAQVDGSGRKGRITKEDVQGWVKTTMAGTAVTGTAVTGFAWPEMPAIDFSKFGPTEELPLSRIRQVAARNLHRSWLHVPHVTQHDEADITEMEAFRQGQKEQAARDGYKLTPVAFLLKAAAAALRQFPDFNSSLHPSGKSIVRKGYVHIGIAVDTPGGLVVPVLRDVDQKGLAEIGLELVDVSGRARAGKLLPQDFQGGCFTISSLGGIGGTAFTPIVNAPEVAILGVSRSQWKPVWQGEEFVPRLLLPLSLSYDHRVIDGAAAARFIVHLSGLLSDIRRLLL